MTKTWKLTTLGEVCDIVGGGTPSKANKSFYGGNIPWATVRDMNCDQLLVTEHTITKEGVKNSSTNIIPGGNVIIASRVGLGKVCLLGQSTAINQDLRGVIPKNGNIDVRFLFYWFKSVSERIVGAGKGATVQGITLPFLKSLEFPLHSIAEQKRIVGILDETFEAIDKAKRNVEKNLQNARELLESQLLAVFAKRRQGWTETSLGEVCSFVGGSQPPKSVFTKEQRADTIRLIQIRDYKSDKHAVYIPRDKARRFCAPDDIMIGRYGPPLFQILRGLDGAYNVALMKAVPDESRLSRDFLFYFLRNSEILRYVNFHSSRTAGQTGVTKETLYTYPICFPSLIKQKQLVETFVLLESETEPLEAVYRQKLFALEELKKSLLHRAFSGELTKLQTGLEVGK